MKLHLTRGEGNLINAHHPDRLTINGETHTRSLIVLPHRLITDWRATAAHLTPEALHQAAEHATRGMVVLLGAGTASPPITPRWQAPFAARGAVLEIMSLPAACRTYNFLTADGRAVMAALAL